MQRAIRPGSVACLAAGLALPVPALAGITVYEAGERSLSIGGRVQTQYNVTERDPGADTDDLGIRRAWLTFDVSIAEHWAARLQYQVNGGGSTKDAKVRYTGWSFADITVGNFYVPFSREELTSTKRQQLVEKTPVAGTGAPARHIGAALGGGREWFNWRAGVWEAGLESDPSDIDFGSQVDGDQDYEGLLVGGRVEFHPGGDIGFGQGNLGGVTGWEVGINAFDWSNDEDRVASATADYDRVTGYGVDAAWRRGGWSVDAEVNRYDAETLGGGVTSGIVDGGEAEVTTASLEGGYMIVAETWELVAGHGVDEAEARAEAIEETGIGVNRFFRGHDAKLQASLVSTANVGGVDGADRTDLYVQLQFAF